MKQTYDDGRLISPCSPLFEQVCEDFRTPTTIETFQRVVASFEQVRRSGTADGQFYYSPHNVPFCLYPTTVFDCDELNSASVFLRLGSTKPLEVVVDLFRILQQSLERTNCCLLFEPETGSELLSLASCYGFNRQIRRSGDPDKDESIILCSCSPSFSLIRQLNDETTYKSLV